MLKRSSILFLLVVSFSIKAQESTMEKNIKNVIDRFFVGLHAGDSAIVSKTLHKELKIQTTATNQQGEHLLKTETREQLLTSIQNKNPAHIYKEKLLSYTIHIDGNLASVWTPYEFYFNDNFSHCGANSFQLYDNNGTWEIIYLVDMRRTEHCKPKEDKK